MSPKEKELVAVAVSVAAGCEACTQHHVKAARAAGACADGLRRMVELALTVRQRATQRMAAVAHEELGVAADLPSCEGAADLDRLAALASAAAALAANCGAGVPGFLAAAKDAGATEHEGEVALGIARQIKKVAADEAEEASRAEGTPATPCSCAAVTRAQAGACC